MKYLFIFIFLLSLMPASALPTLVGDNEEALYLEWPEGEWRLEGEEKKETSLRLSLVKNSGKILEERALLSAEPLPEEGFLDLNQL